MKKSETVIIDNYDSFTYNLYQVLGALGEEPVVFRNNEIGLQELERLEPERIIISPGPGTVQNPADFGVCLDAIKVLGKRIPILGVCLGHQGIGYAFGGSIIRAPKPLHGKKSRITHDGTGVFKGIRQGFEAMRYHSLAIDPSSVPDCLEVTAHSQDGVIMGVSHRSLPIFGVQFHPESVGTALGSRILQNFLSVKKR